jgi:predicted RecB family nuclease
MSPDVVITDSVFEAALQCETKAYLLLDGAAGPDPDNERRRRTVADSYRQVALDQLRLDTPEAEYHEGLPSLHSLKQARYRLISEPVILASGFRAHLHALERSRLAPGAAPSYIPVRFGPDEKLNLSAKMLVAYDALVLAKATGDIPRVGRIVHGRRQTSATVSFAKLLGAAEAIIGKIATLRSSAEPPPLILNRHCPVCQFRSRCRQTAIERDDLSLLANITAKERQKLNGKGIFTVTQLSHTFRPRRRTVRAAPRPHKHDPALKALAIRTGRIHVIGAPSFYVPESAVYFDVEGVPDREFYYLIGVRHKSGGGYVQRSFWADSEADERAIWVQCASILAEIENPVLVHYGSYETKFLNRMKARYSNSVDAALTDRLAARAVNLLSLTYAQVYFPTYSNGLKEIARHLGFRWSENGSSGLQALIWRSQWELAADLNSKKSLVAYNAEDCEALQRVAETLASVCSEHSVTMSNGVSVNANQLQRKFPQRFGKFNYAVQEFKAINDAAYWDYQRGTIHVRSGRSARSGSREINTRKKPRVNLVTVRQQRPEHCPRCASNVLYRHTSRIKATYDIVFFKTGVRLRALKVRFPRFRCTSCGRTFSNTSNQEIRGWPKVVCDLLLN